MINSARGKILLGLSLLCCGEIATADEFHYNNMLIGDRAAGMGGAYTAVSDDATGMYYNPAGIVFVGDRNFSASVNAFYSQTKEFENVIGNQSFERNSSALLANYFGIVKPLGKYKIGFSYAVPDAVSENQNQEFTNNVVDNYSRQIINLSNRDSTYNVGPTVAAEINDDLSVGLTLYVHQRDVQIVLNQFVERMDTGSGTSTGWTNKYFRMNETGIKPIIGVSWSPVEKVSLGFALSKTFIMSSSATGQETCWDSVTNGCTSSTAPPTTVRTPVILNFTEKREYPTHLAIGAAYFASKDLLISADWSYNTAVEDPIFVDKVATYNFALGTEYYMTRKWAVRAGVFTNMANTPDIQAGVTNIEEQINLYGASLSLTNFSGSSSVTVGGSVNYGTGKAQMRNDQSVQNATTLGWLLFLSSSY
ncbi:MAG: outer membrane protein transport protein [Aquabacterium sp.]|uniref:OmpP1/FadL family transporter n=1 Tax=Aquabacterium sp. TaxID=1872578 RepID=UPI002724EEB4|nr:outer membrane protein transport protein [Aquabacterium sp.]MDO9005028.1 outer membrane protein transport protein [Aquabacterium sp.]